MGGGGSRCLLVRGGDGFAFDGPSVLRFRFRQNMFRLSKRFLGELGLFPGAAGGFLGLFAPALGLTHLLLGRLPLTFRFSKLDAGKLDFVG